jgi:hypothetical protein
MAAARSAAKVAEQRAIALLRSLLSPAEYHELITDGYLMVPSPHQKDTVYRVPRLGGFVRVYEAGQPLVDLCVQPTSPMPWADVVLTHKLMIESDEAGYLKTANRFRIHRPPDLSAFEALTDFHDENPPRAALARRLRRLLEQMPGPPMPA